MSFGFRATDKDLFKYIFNGDRAKLAKHLRGHPSAAKNAKVTLTHQEKDLVLDLNDGKNFTTVEWLMVFVKVPL